MRLRTMTWLMACAVACSALACAADPEVAKRAHLAKGDEYASAGKLAEAIIEYRQAIQADARYADAHLRLGDALLRNNDFGRAVRSYARAADLLPERADVQIKAGSLLLMGGRFEDAKARADAVLARDRTNIDAHVLRANAIAGLRDLDGALAEIEAAIKQDPDRATSHGVLAMLNAARGDTERAEQAFKRAVDLAPKSVSVHLALANFYWSTHRNAEAERTLRQALQLEPGNALANRAMAYFCIAAGRAADAEPYLRAVVASHATLQARLSLIDYYLALDRSNDAVNALEEVVKLPEPAAFAEGQVRLAAVEASRGQRDAAIARLNNVLTRDEHHGRALALKAALLHEQGRSDDAIRVAESAAAASPADAHVHMTLGRIHAARREPDAAIAAYTEALSVAPRLAMAHIELARLYMEKGQSRPALDHARAAELLLPEDDGVRLLVVRALAEAGDVNQAETSLAPLVERHPSSASVQVASGVLNLRKRDAVRAELSFRRALSLDAANTEAFSRLALLYVAQQRTAEARSLAVDAVKRRPDDPAVLLVAARVQTAAGETTTAEKLLQHVLEVDPANLAAYRQLGTLYVRLGRLDQAEREYRVLADRQPKAVAPPTLLGNLAVIRKQPDAARRWFERALAIDPHAPVAANNLAWLHAQEGQNLDIALQLAQTAKARLPDQPEISDTLGWIYVKKGLLSLAIPPLRESVTADPQNPVYQFHLGVAYARVGDRRQAESALREALRLNPNFDGATEARALLDTLRS